MDTIFHPELRTWIYPPYPFLNEDSSDVNQVSSQLQLQEQREAEVRIGTSENASDATATTATPTSKSCVGPESEKEKPSEKNILQTAGPSSGLHHVDVKQEIDLILKSEMFSHLDNDSQDEFMTFLNSKENKCYINEEDMDLGGELGVSFNLGSSDSDSDDSIGIIDINQAYGRFSGPASDVISVMEDDQTRKDECASATAPDCGSSRTKKNNVETETNINRTKEAEEPRSLGVSTRGRKRKQARSKEIESSSKPRGKSSTSGFVDAPVKKDKLKNLNQKIDWNTELRTNLEMDEDDFSKFVETQGFLSKSSKMNSLGDFGCAEPKGAMKFATQIPDSCYDYSNSLRIYRNMLKKTHAYGITIANAADQAFYQPDDYVDMPKADRLQKLDPNEMIISVDCYHSSISLNDSLVTELKTAKLPSVAITVEILATQTLENLQSRLFCENDLVYISEINHPNEAKKLNWNLCAGVYDKKTFQSPAIFIENTIYTADVIPNYGHKLKKWVGQKFLGNSKEIEIGSLSTKIKETKFRPGYPYLYRHNDCEHLLMFTNVRTVHPTDPQIPKLYPRVTFVHTLPSLRCRFNHKHLAKFVVKNDPRLPETVVPLCKECCLTFCYTGDGRSRDTKTGNFQLYPLIQMSALPFPPNLK